MAAALNIIFMGTPEFTLPTLQAIHNSTHNLIAVYTQPPKPAGRKYKLTPSASQIWAEKHEIAVYHPKTLKKADTISEFSSLQADIAIIAAYGLLLPEAILQSPKYGCVNIHPSLLPRWRGAAPLQRQIMAGDAETGVMLFKMGKGLDDGDIISEYRTEMPDNINCGQLHDMLAQKGAKLTIELLDYIANHNKLPDTQPQNHEKTCYAHKINNEDLKINWHNNATDIQRQIAALAPTPKAQTILYNTESKEELAIKIIDSEIVTGINQDLSLSKPGDIIDNQLTIICGDNSFIRPKTLQKPGKKAMKLADFLNGIQNFDCNKYIMR